MSKGKKARTTTVVRIEPTRNPLSQHAVVAAVGSCFAQDIVGRMLADGFSGVQNPNGIVYNAVSMGRSIQRACEGRSYRVDELFEHGGQWHSWEHHGRFSQEDRDSALKLMNQRQQEFHAILSQADLLILTPSSSVVYEYLPEQRYLVANCHRVPNHLFDRRLLSVEENFKAMRGAVDAVLAVNPEIRVVVTLSPVRHYPGDLVLNARSKAHLLTAIHQCCDAFDQVDYFPAYEIVLDELRDYTFYKEDLLHPNEEARTHVYDAFMRYLMVQAVGTASTSKGPGTTG